MPRFYLKRIKGVHGTVELNKKYMKKILSLLVVLFSTWSGNVAFAQFYDDEDEILFYQCVLLNGKVNDPSTNNNSYVFNFDGNKATTFGFNTTLKIKSNLKNNNNYYEGKVFDVKFDVKYRSDLSSSSWIVYSRYQTGYVGSWTSYWYFSRDRKTMIYKESSSNNEWTYKLVEKSYYVEEGRRRSNLNDEKIYE